LYLMTPGFESDMQGKAERAGEGNRHPFQHDEQCRAMIFV